MTKAGQRLIEAAREAAAIAHGIAGYAVLWPDGNYQGGAASPDIQTAWIFNGEELDYFRAQGATLVPVRIVKAGSAR